MNRKQAKKLDILLSEAFVFEKNNNFHNFTKRKRKITDDLYEFKSNIVGIGIGKDQDGYHVRVAVNEDFDISNLSTLCEILKIDSKNLKIVVTGDFSAANNPIKNRIRPAPFGCSIGHFNNCEGTLGCLVKDDTNIYILSNNHVIADENNGFLGDAILQPAPADNGINPFDKVATLNRFIQIDFNGNNFIDAALALVDVPNIIDNTLPNSIPLIGTLKGVSTARVGMNVAKYGRETGFTTGQIVSVSFKANVRMKKSGNKATFVDQIEIVGSAGDFAKEGDSGSLIVDLDTKKAVGLLFAVSFNNHTLANHINKVFTDLNVSLL